MKFDTREKKPKIWNVAVLSAAAVIAVAVLAAVAGNRHIVAISLIMDIYFVAVIRSGLYARREKIRALGMGARTKWYFWPNASVREFAGLLIEHRLKQAVILFGLIVLNVILVLLAYRA